MKIAVLVGGVVYETQKRLLDGIIKYADAEKVCIDVFTCNGDIYKRSDYGMGEFQIYSLPDLTKYDGIIFARDTIQDEQSAGEITQKILDSGVPTVSIENHILGMTVFYTDNRAAMYEMVSHMIRVHKVKRICYLSGPKENPESVERLEGAVDAMAEHGLEFGDGDIYYGNYWTDSGRQLAAGLISSGKRLPEAVVCANDDMALGVYMELCRHSIQVGKDILLSGFDHSSVSADLTPAITTVEKPQEQIGYEACKTLVEHRDMHDRKFQVRCCYKGSCGCTEHMEHDLPEVQLRNLEQKLEAVGIAEMNKNMASDLNDCENLQDFCECLKGYIEQMDFSFLYLCLCENQISEDKTEYDYKIREGYPERIYIPVAYEKGIFTEYQYFECKKIVPDVCRGKMGNIVCIIAPLHFRKNCLGYLVMSGSDLPFQNVQFQNWVMNLSNALENLRKQEELKRLVKKLNSMWVKDNLTQIYNRAGFFRYADRILAECREQNIPIGLLFADINKLKLVNDGYGHEEGDFYIKSVADKLKALKKENQLLMRYGGDEFVVLGNLAEGDEFISLMKDLNPGLEEYRQQQKKEYEMSVSIGFCSVSVTDGFRLDQLMEEADREMYQMKKKKGRAEV